MIYYNLLLYNMTTSTYVISLRTIWSILLFLFINIFYLVKMLLNDLYFWPWFLQIFHK